MLFLYNYPITCSKRNPHACINWVFTLSRNSSDVFHTYYAFKTSKQNDECVKHPRSSVNVYTKRGGLRLGTNLKVTWVNNMAASGGKWRIFCRVSLAVLFLVILNCELIYTTKPTIAVKQSMPLTSGKYTCRDVYIYTSI